MSGRRWWAIARKEILHIVRDPRSLASAIATPLTMLLIFGYALSLDVDRIPTILFDLDHTPQSRELTREFRGSRYFQVVEESQSYRPVEAALDARRALLAVVIPPMYSRHLLSGEEATVQLLLDGSDSNTASIAQGYAEGVVQLYGGHVRTDAQTMRAGKVPRMGVGLETRVWYNPDMLSRNFIVPGLIAVIMMIITGNLSSLTIAREWESGTMEQLLSTPVRPFELALGKLSAYFLVGLIDMSICLVMGVFVFDVPFKGNLLVLIVSSCVFLFGALSTGILISAAARTQLIAYQLGTLTTFLPGFLLSGFIYSISSMPRVIQLISLLVPARYFINIIKAVFLKGTAIEMSWLDFILLCVYGAVMFFFTVRKLRQKVA
ncbi:MAG TPA: ABC transporter permease [Bryobacteraceae bacterium]|nr:ABC transporter permease [Bryobacteraceae bacterium]